MGSRVSFLPGPTRHLVLPKVGACWVALTLQRAQGHW